MKKGAKQPRVTYARAMDWLKRSELDENPTEISKTDGYDARTVRNQIALMKKERDEREVRQGVLRDALIKHFADICSFARKLEKKIASMKEPFPISDDLTNDPIWFSLREHLPRSPLWKNLDALKDNEARFRESVDTIRGKITTEVTVRAGMLGISDPDGKGILDGWRDGLLAHVKLTTRLGKGIEDVTYRKEPKTGKVELFKGAYSLGTMPENQVEAVEKLFDDLLKDVPTFEGYALLKENTDEFMRIQSSIHEEFNKIILRRVVAGRCRYCPY
ncbi:MAG: hypothetical protein NTZ34_06290 [Chloroflexi bacterium]|nr:hypothetical protein [Chloroflexota bacterium]